MKKIQNKVNVISHSNLWRHRNAQFHMPTFNNRCNTINSKTPDSISTSWSSFTAFCWESHRESIEVLLSTATVLDQDIKHISVYTAVLTRVQLHPQSVVIHEHSSGWIEPTPPAICCSTMSSTVFAFFNNIKKTTTIIRMC